MRWPMVRAVLAREFLEIVRNRLLLASILVPPIILTALPLAVIAFAGHQGHLPPSAVAQIVANHPNWADMSTEQVIEAFGLGQFLVSFLILPGYIPLAIASYSVVGEKQSRSLEAVLATPIRTSELLTGKALAALIPGIVASWTAYAATLSLSALVFGGRLAMVIAEPTWLAAVFALGPAIGLVSVTAGILVSSRVNDPRAAQQIGAVILLPIIGVTVLQASGNFLIGPTEYVAGALVVAVIGAIGIRIGTVVFGRETILTRWK
ncbi:MAG TPA: ABC transporter permease subunit [Candidatus Saccharimonadales bacterium]|nr:ABC transporter permease subunit [Candidatus Saccharimonadales bacterium]